MRDFILPSAWCFYAVSSNWPESILFPIYFERKSTLSTKDALTGGALKKYIHKELRHCEDTDETAEK